MTAPVQQFDSRQGQCIFSKNVYTESGAHLAFCAMVSDSCFPGAKRPGRDADHIRQVPRQSISGAVPLLALYVFMAYTGTFLYFYRIPALVIDMQP